MERKTTKPPSEPSVKPRPTAPPKKSFLDYITPDNPNGILSILAYRLLLSLYIRSYFAPDEYWQSVEIAHKMVFGYGHETWEWTIPTPIRSTLHPFLYAIVYWVLSFFSMDTGFLVAYSPRLVQGILLALTDFYVYKIAKDLFKDRYTAQLSVLLHMCGWFVNYAMVRTLSNSVETTLVVIAYYYWTKLTPKYSNTDTVVGVLYAIAFLIRPTSGIIFATLVVLQIYNHGLVAIVNLFKSAMLGAMPVILIGIAIDSWYFGSFQIPMINFARVNIFAGISVFYGTHPALWYLFAGFPLILLTYLPFSFYGLYKAMKELFDCTIAYVIITYWTVMSLLTHKEERFMMPILPFFIILAGHCLAILRKKSPKWGLGFLIVAIGTQLLFLGIWNNFYRVGSLQVMDELRRVSPTELKGVYFLTDCHATPFYSHIHRNIPMGFPTCPPPLNETLLTNDRDRMFNDTAGFLDTTLSRGKYSHIVMPNYFENKTETVLQKHGYKKMKDIYHSIFEEVPGGVARDVRYYIYNKK